MSKYQLENVLIRRAMLRSTELINDELKRIARLSVPPRTRWRNVWTQSMAYSRSGSGGRRDSHVVGTRTPSSVHFHAIWRGCFRPTLECEACSVVSKPKTEQENTIASLSQRPRKATRRQTFLVTSQGSAYAAAAITTMTINDAIRPVLR